MAIKRYRRGKYVVATEKSLFSTSGLTGGAVQRLWSDAQTPDSVCSTRRIGYNHGESPAMVAGATPSGKSRITTDLLGADLRAWAKQTKQMRQVTDTADTERQASAQHSGPGLPPRHGATGAPSRGITRPASCQGTLVKTSP